MSTFKSNARRGGLAENVFMRNVEPLSCIAVLHRPGERSGADYRFSCTRQVWVGPYKPVVRKLHLENVRSTNSPRAVWIASFPGAVIDDVSFVIVSSVAFAPPR